MKRILVVGSANVDLVMSVDRLPIVGETMFGAFSQMLGGKGANQAVAAARAGGTVSMTACVGDDGFGLQLRRGLSAEGIDITGVATVSGTSGVASILTARGQNNMIIVASGANAKLAPSSLDAALFERTDYVLLQLETPLETVAKSIELAKAAGAQVILDPAPAQPLPRAILERLDWLTPNESEARLLLSWADEEIDGAAAAKALQAQGARGVVVKLGARGAVVVAPGAAPVALPPRAVHAVDTTAAGDAFNGAFAVALAEGKGPVDAARFAIVASSIAVSRHGAQAAMASRSEIDAGASHSVGGTN
jgi:ribokinase